MKTPIIEVLRRPFLDPYSTPSLLLRLAQEHALKHWRSYFLAYLLMAVVSACTAGYTYVLGRVVNETHLKESYSGVLYLCIATALIFAVRGMAYYGQAVLLARINNQIVSDIQKSMFDKLLQHSLAYFSASHTSFHTAQITYGCMGAASILNILITATGRDLLLLVGLVAVMFHEDPMLTAVSAVVLPAAMILLRDIIKRVREHAFAQYAGSMNVLMMLQDTLQGMRVVKAFQLEKRIRELVTTGIDNNLRAANRMADLSNRPTPLMEMLGGFAIVGIFIYAAVRINTGNGSPGSFVAFATAFLLAYEPSKRLARINIELTNYLLPARLLFQFLDQPPSEPQDGNRPALTAGTGRIEFRNVSFAYPGNASVLHDVSFVAEQGHTTALVGASGAGKSTILSLLLRFFEPQQGEILIDNQNIGLAARDSVRGSIAYVGQDTFLFSSTIRENIACGADNPEQGRVVEAAKAAHLHTFIQSLPQGYDTPVGEQGAKLSGGERQRVAIARALVKDAPIILLDEPTNSLDNESELIVREAMMRLCRGRTTIVVAHRLHTVAYADKIIVIEHGKVVEEGRHFDLVRRGGRYSMLYRLQHLADSQDAQVLPLLDGRK